VPPALRGGPNLRLFGAISSCVTFVFEGATQGIGACSSLDLVRLGGLVVKSGVAEEACFTPVKAVF